MQSLVDPILKLMYTPEREFEMRGDISQLHDLCWTLIEDGGIPAIQALLDQIDPTKVEMPWFLPLVMRGVGRFSGEVNNWHQTYARFCENLESRGGLEVRRMMRGLDKVYVKIPYIPDFGPMPKSHTYNVD